MNTIDTTCIVNYKYNEDPSFIPLNEEEQKIKAFKEAEVIYLLYNHNQNTPEIFKAHCIYHETIIKNIYKPDDIILTEEDCQKKSTELSRNFTPNLDPSIYQIKGWDDHDCYLKTQDFYSSEKKTKQALQNVCHPNLYTAGKISEDWKLLMTFGKNHDNKFLSQIQQLSVTELNQLKNIRNFLMQCNIDLNSSKIKFIYETFAQRQLSLEKCRETNLSDNLLKKRKVIALMGKNHGNPSDVKILPIVTEHFQNLNRPYVVIDPSMIKST